MMYLVLVIFQILGSDKQDLIQYISLTEYVDVDDILYFIRLLQNLDNLLHLDW
jgi:hypothetical protein